MNVNVNEVRIMSQIRGSPSGVRSVFVKIDDKWAIKLFEKERHRDRAYRNQKQAAEYKLGPDVGKKIDFSVSCDYPYGYITEIVDVLVPHSEIVNRDYDSYNYYCYGDGKQKFDKLVDELSNKLEECTGIRYRDLHPANIGIKNGYFVLIDFGQEDIY